MVARNNNEVRHVQVARVPGTFVTVAVTSGMSVRQALAAGGITPARDEQVRANGDTVSLDDVVNGFTTITVTKNIKGNM